MTTFWLAAPLLAIGFIAGIVISLVQIATSMQDNAFSTIPRLAAFLAGLLFLLPWMLQRTMAYTIALFWETWAGMPANVTAVGRRAVSAFLLVLARVGGALVFVPLPGCKSAPEPVRVALALGFTLALYGQWPAVDGTEAHGGACWPAGSRPRRRSGIAIGSAVAIVARGIRAGRADPASGGYAYASTIDPNTEADSGVLLVFAQLMARHAVLRPGTGPRSPAAVRAEPGEGSAGRVRFQPRHGGAADPPGRDSVFGRACGWRLPVVALLMMVDVALALLGRLNPQLQLLTLAFPAKMLTALLLLSWIAPLFPRILREVERPRVDRRATACWGYDAPWRTRAGKPNNRPSDGWKRRARKAVSVGQGVRRGAAVHGLSGAAGRGRRRTGSSSSGRPRAPSSRSPSPRNCGPQT